MTWHVTRGEGTTITCDHNCDARLFLGRNTDISLAARAAKAGWVVHWPRALRHSCPAHANQPIQEDDDE